MCWLGTALFLVACTAPSDQRVDVSADLAAITALHEADVAGVLAGDVDAVVFQKPADR